MTPPTLLGERSVRILRLAGGRDMDGRLVDVDCADGVITAVRVGGVPGNVPRFPTHEVVDLSGMVLTPALVEPHAHIDKAYTADLYPNPTGDLRGAIEVSQRAFTESTVEEISRRARRALLAYLAKGCLAVRTHVAVGSSMGLRSMEGVAKAAAEFHDLLDVQIVAHIGPPLTGPAGREHLALLREAIAMGATLVGGTPYRAEDPVGETHACLGEAAAAELGVDLHTDETLDAGTLTVHDLAIGAQRSGFAHPVTASHCVSLGMQEPAVQQRIAELLATAGIAVIALPQTNLYLQGRSVGTAKPRGLTSLPALYGAGVCVAAGGDNVQDPFNPMGRGDPLEAASLLVTAGHLDARTAFDAVTASARAVLGLPPVALAVGSPADLVAIPGASLREAIAEADSRRVVVRRGEVVDVTALAGWPSATRPDREVAGV